MLSREEIDLYRALFVGRRDAYALQEPTGRYTTVREPVTDDLIRAHLGGEVTCAWLCFDERDRLHWACVDADRPDGRVRLQWIHAELLRVGLLSYVEGSHAGRGHLWLFLEPQPARAVRRLLQPIVGPVAEIFPKSDSRRRGLGPTVRGPLGIHLRAGRRFGFLEPADLEEVGATVSANLARLASARRYGPEAIARAAAAWRPLGDPVTVPAHPLPDALAVASLFTHLEERDGFWLGRCPRHPSGPPSLVVYPGSDRWYCLSEGTGGNGLDLYALLKGLPLRRAALALAGFPKRALPATLQVIER